MSKEFDFEKAKEIGSEVVKKFNGLNFGEIVITLSSVINTVYMDLDDDSFKREVERLNLVIHEMRKSKEKV